MDNASSTYSQEKHFHFAGHDTVALARKYGTPLYVVSEDLIRHKCGEIRRTFLDRYKGSRAAYASKAFLTMAMCRIIENEGLCLDVVSAGELYTALQAGFPGDRIIFHGNNKSLAELQMAVDHQVGRIVVDNVEEVEYIHQLASEVRRCVCVQIRLVPEVEAETHRHILTGQKDSKFGIPMNPAIIDTVVDKVMNSPWIELKGFHFHIGSNLRDPSVYADAVRKVMALSARLKKEMNFQLEELNAGGGFGIPYQKTDTVLPLSSFTEAIMQSVAESCREHTMTHPTVIIEPGRWIVGEAGITLYTIGTIKNIPGIRVYASVDGGLPDNIRPALYGAVYDGIIANKNAQEKTQVVTIAGKCCETGDILIWDLRTPPIERGDVLAVLTTGAYGESMSNNYNRMPRPAVVLLSGDQDRVMIRRETLEDLLRREREAPSDERNK